MTSVMALNALGHASSGSLGTAVSTVVLYPLDLITTRLKAKEHSNNDREVYEGVIDALKHIVAHEGGVSALYNGLGIDIAKSILDSFLFFGVYSYLRNHARQPPRILHELALGALAGACTKVITTPLSNVVARKQLLPGAASLTDISASIYKEQGVLGFWSGYSATLLLTMNPSITFLINNRLARRLIPALKEEDVPIAWVAFLIAALSKASATAMTYPLQAGKTRLQMAEGTSDQPGSDWAHPSIDTNRRTISKVVKFLNGTIIGVILRIVREEGFQALYQGIHGELLKSFFSHGLTMFTKGILHRFIIRLGLVLIPRLRNKRLHTK